MRASLFTGQYVHTHGVLTNAFATGGGARMFADAQTIATELQARGVLTALIGTPFFLWLFAIARRTW